MVWCHSGGSQKTAEPFKILKVPQCSERVFIAMQLLEDLGVAGGCVVLVDWSDMQLKRHRA